MYTLGNQTFRQIFDKICEIVETKRISKDFIENFHKLEDDTFYCGINLT